MLKVKQLPLVFKDKLTKEERQEHIEAIGKVLEYYAGGSAHSTAYFTAIGIDGDGYLICKYKEHLCP